MRYILFFLAGGGLASLWWAAALYDTVDHDFRVLAFVLSVVALGITTYLAYRDDLL